MEPSTEVSDTPASPVSLREAFPVWCRVAALSFGGPAGQIAVMHRILVEEKKWIDESRFLHALNYCMLLPGPEAQQLATYIGWLMHRALGGLMAGLLFILPGCIAILALSITYATYQNTDFVQALFYGLKPAVIAIVFEAVLRIGKRVLKNRTMASIAVASFTAIFVFEVPFPILVAAAAIIGGIGGKVWPSQFYVMRGHGNPAAETTDAAEAGATHVLDMTPVRPTLWRAVRISAIFLTLWFGPLVALDLLLGRDSVFVQEGIYFSKAAVVTFGGAYAVLAYIAQEAVDTFHWLLPGEMLDGLGMAETTPGPLIMVVQFVGFMGAYRHPGPFEPLAAGILGSCITTWVTFVPCFFWIFLGAPYVETLRGNRLLASSLSAITAAVVGVVLNLAVWFSLNTLFPLVDEQRVAGIRQLPDWTTLDVAALAIGLFACVLTFRWKAGMLTTLAACCALGATFHALLK
jgi:chromate transporter